MSKVFEGTTPESQNKSHPPSTPINNTRPPAGAPPSRPAVGRASTGRPTGAPPGRPPVRPSGSHGGGRSGGSGNRGGGNRPSAGGRPGGAGLPGGAPPAPPKPKPTEPVAIPAVISVRDLGLLLSISPSEVIKELVKNNIFATINQTIDYDTAAVVATDLGYQIIDPKTAVAESASEHEAIAVEAPTKHRDQAKMVHRAPVVTIMGHVDHGKTSLLDTIRKTKVAAGEAGGITQHIGAYQVESGGKKITFLDTPGHEAFTAMRARGAQVTDIAIIVVAADDGIMPQTIEAIDHARAAKVPLVVAINKIDKPGANPDRVKQQLADVGVLVEDWGGDTVSVSVSAKKNIGIDDLLEMILLVAEVADLKADPTGFAEGVIVEAKMDRASGPIATALIQQGQLKLGDNIVVGSIAGKVRAMFNDKGKRIKKAEPAMPVGLLGLPEVPQAGDRLEATFDEKIARQLSDQRSKQKRSDALNPSKSVDLESLFAQAQAGTIKELNLLVKSDVQGSAEAIKQTLEKLTLDTVKVRLLHDGIGTISETDVHLASASKAIIIGFNVKIDPAARRLADQEGIEIRQYDIIYKLVEDIEAAMKGMLEPIYREVIEGHSEVRNIFKVGKTGQVAGVMVIDGKISRSSQIRVLRKGSSIHDGKIVSLRRFKDDVKEVLTNFDCGITLENFNSYETGDILEAHYQERVN